MSFTSRVKSFGVAKALDYLEKDPDANLPKLMDWVDKFGGGNIFPEYRDVIQSALSDRENNWYRLIKSMYCDIDNRVLKKIFENFIIHAGILDWPRASQAGGWPEGEAPWAVLIDPLVACNMQCAGCGAAVYGVRPAMEFDSLDEEIVARKAKGTHLYIFNLGNLLEREEEMVALCNKHSDCVFAIFASHTVVTRQLAEDMLRVGNLFPAILMSGERANEEETRAMNLLRRYRLPFGVACPCTAKNADRVGTSDYYDHLVGLGAKFCWYFTCPAVSRGEPATLGQLSDLHQRVREFRGSKPLLTLDFWDRPSPSSVARQQDVTEEAQV